MYIKREDVMPAVEDAMELYPSEYDSIANKVDNIHAANVKEIVYGTWRLETDEEEPNPMFKLVECSNCKELANTNYKFCPNCGATMTGLSTEGTKGIIESGG